MEVWNRYGTEGYKACKRENEVSVSCDTRCPPTMLKGQLNNLLLMARQRREWYLSCITGASGIGPT